MKPRTNHTEAETRHRCSQIVFILCPSLLNTIKVVENPSGDPQSANLPLAARKTIHARIIFWFFLRYPKINWSAGGMTTDYDRHLAVFEHVWHRFPVRRCTWGLLLPLILRWWSQRYYCQRSQISIGKSKDREIIQLLENGLA